MRVNHERLKSLVQTIFAKAGCQTSEAERIAHRLVEANLVGHDSHGVIRVSYYIDYLRNDLVRANRTMNVVFETDVLAVVDGDLGFGQVIGEQAMQLGISKADRHGVAVVALRNCGHLGRIGDWPELIARSGKASLHFVNTSGFGLLVAPFGGIDRRLSANPIAAGIPVADGPPIILDISTCAIAEGKIKVAFNKGTRVPQNCILDADGKPTDDPEVFYADSPGSILPFGGHKGYGLGIVAELLAGAFTGSGCSKPDAPRLLNGMLTIILDPERIPTDVEFADEVQRFIQFVKSSRTASANDEILMPGEPEQRTCKRRIADGIPLDENTWNQILETCRSLDITEDEVESAVRE
jgi:hydroxycarboxylate dehydrogenase B